MHNFCMEARGSACTFLDSHAKHAKASLFGLSLEVMSEQLQSLRYYRKYFIQRGHSHNKSPLFSAPQRSDMTVCRETK